MSFVITHSQTRIEGIMGTKTTFNQHKYNFFLKEVINRLKREVQYQSLERVVIVADNWVFHRTKLIKSYITKEKLRWFFTPPYSPEINAWEKLINLIKSRGMHWQKNKGKFLFQIFRLINLKFIQKIIDEINADHCKGFIRASMKETLHHLELRLQNEDIVNIVESSCLESQ